MGARCCQVCPVLVTMVLQDGTLIQRPQFQGRVFLTFERPQDEVQRHFLCTSPPPLPSWWKKDSYSHLQVRKLSPPVERGQGEGSVGGWDSFHSPLSITRG